MQSDTWHEVKHFNLNFPFKWHWVKLLYSQSRKCNPNKLLGFLNEQCLYNHKFENVVYQASVFRVKLKTKERRLDWLWLPETININPAKVQLEEGGIQKGRGKAEEGHAC